MAFLLAHRPYPGQTETMPCTDPQVAADDQAGLAQTTTLPNSDLVDLTSAVEEALIAFLLF